MATYYDKCQCGNKKAVLNATCRSCYIRTIKSIKSTRPKKETDDRQTRTCKGCYQDFKTRVRAKYCGRCNNWGNKNGRGALLLKHNLEVCDDPDRKAKILEALAVEQSNNPAAVAVASDIERQIAELREGMVAIVRSDPFPSGADADGYPLYKKQNYGWRCPKCRQPQKKRCCRLCEMKIRGSI